MPNSQQKKGSGELELAFPSDPSDYTLDKQIGKGVSSTVRLQLSGQSRFLHPNVCAQTCCAHCLHRYGMRLAIPTIVLWQSR